MSDHVYFAGTSQSTIYSSERFSLLRALVIFLLIGLASACASSSSKDGADMTSSSFKQIESEIIVSAPINVVWQDWTTVTGQEAFFGGKVSLDLRVNGRHDVWFLPDAPEGQRGHEDGRILAIEEPHLLTFTWTMPPYMPKIRPHHTVVQVMFDALDNERTRIRLLHAGFGEGEHWQQGYDYFEGVWSQVLTAYQTSKQ